MIEKKIHYCWFGGNPLPSSANKCIRSWEKFCPGYQIIRWDESNFDIHCNSWCSAMYEQKKWAFLSDYARLKIIYENGGVYLDTDVELVKSLDEVIENVAFMGFDTTNMVNNGLGFGAEKGHPFILENMLAYEQTSNYLNPELNSWITTRLLATYGLETECNTIQQIDNIMIYPPEYFCSKHTHTGLITITEKTIAIHHFNCSWDTEEGRTSQIMRWRKYRRQYFMETPKRLLRKVLGDNRVNILKQKIKSRK